MDASPLSDPFFLLFVSGLLDDDELPPAAPLRRAAEPDKPGRESTKQPREPQRRVGRRVRGGRS